MWYGLMGEGQRVPFIAGSDGGGGEGGGGDSDNGCDWGLVGFQGRDPSTDFRGMGLLGLVQLHHFCSAGAGGGCGGGGGGGGGGYNTQARQALREANHQRRYFPFAATGINVSKLCVDLLRECRLHGLFFDALQMAGHGSGGGGGSVSGGGGGENVCTQAYHNFYCETYTSFCKLWVERDPPNVMSFPDIFGEFSDSLRAQYPAVSAGSVGVGGRR
eukprot:GSChrysophyteH2.ASY1.ANO1.1724.1 assembled CDS